MAAKTKPTPPKPATPRVPTARITLGGRERVLEFTMWSQQCLEELTGRPWSNVLADLHLGYQSASVRLLWACLQHEDDPPTIKEVGRALPTDGSAQGVFDIAERVLREALPQFMKEEDNADVPLADAPAA